MSNGADFNQRNIAEFRANHGRVGGQFEGAPLVILHTVGARSGEPRTNIMMYLADGDRYLVFASKAGDSLTTNARRRGPSRSSRSRLPVRRSGASDGSHRHLECRQPAQRHVRLVDRFAV
jgi:deazaflavin-dependent oxidoreductase (nitroreductase family)